MGTAIGIGVVALLLCLTYLFPDDDCDGYE